MKIKTYCSQHDRPLYDEPDCEPYFEPLYDEAIKRSGQWEVVMYDMVCEAGGQTCRDHWVVEEVK